MKDAIKYLVGKTISGVVVKSSNRTPRIQVFLVFTDDTYYEFYCGSGDLTGAGAIDRGGLEAVRLYMAESHKIIQEYSSINKS